MEEKEKVFCYRSKILSGKSDTVRAHWQGKGKVNPNDPALQRQEMAFWQRLQMTDFDSFLQPTQQGDFMIHCLHGKSVTQVFNGLREAIADNDPIALQLQKFYLEVLGKDYSVKETEPQIECVQDLILPRISKQIIKRAFFYPLLPEKVEAHRQFRKDAMGEKRARHAASMQAFGVSRFVTWMQKDAYGTCVVHYSERDPATPTTPQERLKRGQNSKEWQDISAILKEHTGLEYEELSPNVEWLTK